MYHLFLSLLLILMPSTAAVAQQQDDRTYSEMPVVVLYCDEDPGRLNPGGGKEPSPQQLVESGRCTPAEGVALTFVLADDDWDFEDDELADGIDWDVQDDGWFNRCDTAADGTCMLESPTGIDIVIGVVLHNSTVKPGYTPAFFQRGTHNYTEFAGYGLALIPEEAGTTPTGEVGDHQTLALNITENGEPATVLTEWEFNNRDDDDDIYLATNNDGWVSNIVAANDDVKIELKSIDDDDADITVACAANNDASLTVEIAMDDDDEFTISVPDTDSDIRCDIAIDR